MASACYGTPWPERLSGSEQRFQGAQDPAPTGFGGARPFLQHPFVSQGEFTSFTFCNNINAHSSAFHRVLGHGEGEYQTTRPVEFQIFADMLNIFTASPVDRDIRSTNARVDLDPNHFASGRREQKLAGFLRIQPGVEHALGRSVKSPFHADSHFIFETHFDSSLSSDSSRSCRASRRRFQNLA